MTASPTVRRTSLASSYRDLSERQIRAKLGERLTDAERSTAQAELLRRGIESEHGDTLQATGFAPTSGLAPDAATAEAVEPATDASARRARRRRHVVLVAVLLIVIGVAIFMAPTTLLH